MKTRTDVLRYVLTTKDRGFTHHYINGIDTKMSKFQSTKWRIELFFRLVIQFIIKETK